MIRFTPTAQVQLRAAIDRIAACDSAEAEAFVRAFNDRLRTPNTMTGAKPLVEFPQLPARETVVGSYRVFLREVSSQWWVIGVWPENRTSDEGERRC